MALPRHNAALPRARKAAALPRGLWLCRVGCGFAARGFAATVCHTVGHTYHD